MSQRSAPTAPQLASSSGLPLDSSGLTRRPSASGSTGSRSQSPHARIDESAEGGFNLSPAPKRVELAPDQPLTASGKPRERVYLACKQCRTRKIGCDGTKPACNNCSRRTRANVKPCTYDETPRRRGKDRNPGSRKLAPLVEKKSRTTRSRLEQEAKQKRAMKRAASSSLPEASSGHSTPPCRAAIEAPHTDDTPPSHSSQPYSAKEISGDTLASLFLQPGDILPSVDVLGLNRPQISNDRRTRLQPIPHMPATPSIQFVRETWWDSLLNLYASSLDISIVRRPMSADVRNSLSERIKLDVRLLLRISLLWLSFIDVPLFMARLFNPVTRQTIQPSFLLAMLALSTLLQSSELELGTRGMDRALLLADQAYSAFHASLNSGWIDVGLAHAAYILVAFELQAHPQATRPQRTQEAMHMLDSIIRYLGLTTLDVADPRATIFLPHAVPRVPSDPLLIASPPIASAPKKIAMAIMPFADEDNNVPCPMPVPEQDAAANGYPRCGRCGCPSYSLGNQCPSVRMLAPQFAHMPMWPAGEGALGEGELRKEENRRLVWASVVLVTTLGSAKVTAMAGSGWNLQPLWIQDPSNYALLFPGECLAGSDMASVASSKDSVWALYMRAVLLWNGCLRAQRNAASGAIMLEAERARFAMEAWAEMNTIETALDRHSCMTATGFSTKTQEVLFNARLCISGELQRYVPMSIGTHVWLDYREKAEKWMINQLHVAEYFTQCLRNPRATITNHARRNFLVAWILAQIVQALRLWEADHTMGVALDVARTFAPCAEYYLRLWPAAGQLSEYERIYAPLVAACIKAGVEAPARIIPLANLARGAVL